MAGSVTVSKLTSFQPDYPAAGQVPGKRGADGRVHLHEAVLEEIETRTRISKRLSIVVQQMAAHGRSTIVKGCSDRANRGWRRTPLGEHHGMHYYLWWSPQGTRHTRKFKSLRRNAILLRAIRHHDDHRPLSIGKLGEYFALEWLDLDGDSASCFEPPWTDDQKRFALEDKPVRLVYGYPGSGKTAALWRAVEARDVGKTLYLSWSRSLTRHARVRFSAFAPPGSGVEVRDFSTFLGELCGHDVRRQSLSDGRNAFRDAFKWWKVADHQGLWRNRLDALHDELRAVLFGCAVTEMYDCVGSGERLRLSDRAYLAGGVSSVGDDGAAQALELIERSRWPAWYDSVFPELAAARRALARLRGGSLPDGLSDFDRIVVDEVQDLTLLEATVIVRYSRLLAARRGFAPWLLLAFDDGQTVRPSGFDSGRLNRLLHDWLTAPEEFSLEYNVRSPGPIARVIERASVLYGGIRKRSRPVDQRNRIGVQDGAARVDSRLIYAEIEDRAEAREVVGQFGDLDDVALVTPETSVPDWVPRESRSAILTPEEAKGLEYASVCVLDIGSVLTRLRRSVDSQDPLEVHQRRTAIDRLRVAISRATENLILLDVAPDDRARSLCLELLEDAERFSASDLLELFQDADAPPDERVLTRTYDANALADVNLERAWERALQALRLLRGVGGRILVDDKAVQSEVCLTVLSVASQRLVESDLARDARMEIAGIADEVAKTWGNPRQRTAIRHLASWTAEPTGQPMDLLDAVLKLKEADREWLQAALQPASQRLRRAIRKAASKPRLATRFASGMETRLELAGFMGDAGEEICRLRQTAVDALAAAKEFKAARKLLARIDAPEPRLVGLVAEGLRRYAEAGAAYQEAGMSAEALRNWRLAGDFENALEVAGGQTRGDLEWLIAVEAHMHRRPPDLQDRITAAERRRLTGATRMPARRRANAGRRAGRSRRRGGRRARK